MPRRKLYLPSHAVESLASALVEQFTTVTLSEEETGLGDVGVRSSSESRHTSPGMELCSTSPSSPSRRLPKKMPHQRELGHNGRRRAS